MSGALDGPAREMRGDFEALPTVFDSRSTLHLPFTGEAEWAVVAIANSNQPLRHRRPGIIVYGGKSTAEDCAAWCDEDLVPSLKVGVPIQIVEVGLCRPVLVARDPKRGQSTTGIQTAARIIAHNKKLYDTEVLRIRDRADFTRKHHTPEALANEADEDSAAAPPRFVRDTPRWEHAHNIHSSIADLLKYGGGAARRVRRRARAKGNGVRGGGPRHLVQCPGATGGQRGDWRKDCNGLRAFIRRRGRSAVWHNRVPYIGAKCAAVY